MSAAVERFRCENNMVAQVHGKICPEADPRIFPTPKRSLIPNWEAVELKTLALNDHMGAGISILTCTTKYLHMLSSNV